MNESTLAIGTIVIVRTEHPGAKIDGDVHGYLPAGTRGVVSHHTEDGRVVVHFPGYDTHSWHESALLFVVEVEQAELDRLRDENSILRAGANQACEEVHDLATECLERTKTTEALHDEYERLYNAVIVFMNAPGSLTLDKGESYAEMVNCVYRSRFWSVQP